jgi:uncharacterized protein
MSMRALAIPLLLLPVIGGCGGPSANENSVVTVPLAAAPVAGTSGGPALPTPTTPEPGPDLVPVTVLGIAHTPQGAAVLLTDGTPLKVVPIYIGGTEATSITLRFEKRSYARPLTHDLLDHLLRELGAEIVRVQVDDLKDNTYLGTIFLRSKGRAFEVDARPSDAIALALGNKAPIYVARGVIKVAAVPRGDFDGFDDPANPTGQPAP